MSLAFILNLNAEPGAHADFERAVTLSNLATNVLNYTDRARRALQWGETLSARELMEKAIATVDEMEARAGAAGQGLRTPILAEFEQPRFLRSIELSTKQMPGYSALASSPFDAAPSITTLRRSPRIVRRVETPYTSIALDARYARERLEGALSALQRGDPYAADSALSAIQRGVSLLSIEWDQPLVRARQSLGIGRAAALEGDRALTESALRAASNALAEYEKSAPGAHVAEAKSLRGRLSAPAGADRITEWWRQVNGWIVTQPPPRPQPPGMNVPDPWPMTWPGMWPNSLPMIPFS